MRTLSAIETGLGIVAIVTVLLAVAISYGVARTVTRPLARITDHMRQIAATGDLTRKLDLDDSRGWQDEDARVLATTFNTLDRFDRTLSARGRAARAAVVARPHVDHHCARDPQPADDHQGRVAAADAGRRDTRRTSATRRPTSTAKSSVSTASSTKCSISRGPIRFDRAPTDVNALCRAAVSAVAAAEAEPPVVADLDPSAPTTRHRRRAAAHGARQPADQCPPGGARRGTDRRRAAGPAAVKLSTARLSDHRVVDLDRRPRRRHRARGSAARVRSVFHDPPRRHRPRAAHRQEHHRRARRHDHRGQHAGRAAPTSASSSAMRRSRSRRPCLTWLPAASFSQTTKRRSSRRSGGPCARTVTTSSPRPSALEAQRLLVERSFDLLVIDYLMPRAHRPRSDSRAGRDDARRRTARRS